MDPNSPQEPQFTEVTRIGKYDVLDVLGRGGMGVVYRGIDRKGIGVEVAIKTLTQGFTADPGMLARFYEEGRRTGRLKHPNIVTVHDLGDDNGIPYIVMECVDGQPLDRILRSEEPLPLPDRLKILEEVCSALGYAHRNNVIHRDVKPANIFVQPDGTAKLLDFGIARLEKREQDLNLTRTGSIIGTVPYMAPERLRNGNVDSRSDIFSAGVVLYQIITGHLPFAGEQYVLIQKILTEPHPPLSAMGRPYPASLELILDRALAKNPDERYPAAEEMAVDLAAAITELRQEQIHELLPEAQHLVEAQEFTRARSILQQVLKIDGKHEEARRLLSEIQMHFTQRQREERFQQIRQQAEDALSNNRLDLSLSVLEEGIDFDSSNQELAKLRDNVKKEKEKQERINEVLRQAESARRRGDFKSAIAAAKKALKTDPENSKIVALCSLLTKEAEQAQKKAQARTLIDSARAELGNRRYAEAIELLQKAEQLDTANPEPQLLLRDANAGLEQVKRRELISHLEEEVALATTYEKLQSVAQSIQENIAAMPAESALFRLNAQIDRQIRDYENRRLVDETVQACRDLSPREALELVRAARQKVPGDERLLSLEALLADRFKQQTVEERRAEYLLRAREALKTGEYSDAVRILEFCQAEGIATAEILSLLDFARNEEKEHRRQSQLRASLSRAQSLMRDEAYDDCIAYLEEALRLTQDSALQLLLEQATAGRESQRRQIENALASAAKLEQAGKLAESIQLLEMQPVGVKRSVRLQIALTALRENRQQAIFRTIGRAYAVLEPDLARGDTLIRQSLAASGNVPRLKAIADSYRSRGQIVADRQIAEVLRKAKILLRERDRLAAGNLLQSVSGALSYASAEAKNSWHEMQDKMSKTTLISRLRG